MIKLFINKMPSEMNEFFTAAKALTPKVACVENYLMGLRVLQMYLILNIIKYILQMIIVNF